VAGALIIQKPQFATASHAALYNSSAGVDELAKALTRIVARG
jgi:hypothetical protein